jgi:hypothetical protein
MAWDAPRIVFGPEVIDSSLLTPAIEAPLGTGLYLMANVDFTTGLFSSINISVQWTHDEGEHWGSGDPSYDYTFTVFSSDLSRVKRFPIAGTMYRLALEINGVGTSAIISVSEYVTA